MDGSQGGALASELMLCEGHLQQLFHRLKMCHSSCKPEAQERVEKLRSGNGRVLECLALAADSPANCPWGQVVEVGDELIRMLNFDSVSVENLFWEISGVVRNDHPGLGPNRCRKDVPVVWIWEIQRVDEFFETRYQAVRNRSIHQVTGSLKTFPGEIQPLRQQRPDPLIVNPVRPTSSKEIGQSQTKQQVPERSRVEHTGVENGNE